MKPFWIALQFLTVLPTVKINHYGEKALGSAVLCYPLVGVIIGGMLWAGQFLFAQMAWDLPYVDLLVSAVLLTVWVVLTGALHLDGLADCADAWLGGISSKEKTLLILKDPRSGPIAVVTLALTLLLKWIALAILLSQSNAYWLIAIPVLSRAGVLVFFASVPYAREQGIAATMVANFSRRGGILVLSVLLLIALPVGLLIAKQLLYCLIFLTVLFYYFRGATLKRLGGFTGDVLGAWIELAELGLLLVIVFSL